VIDGVLTYKLRIPTFVFIVAMDRAAPKPRSRKLASGSSSSSAASAATSDSMDSIKRSLKARKRRKIINDEKRSKEIPQSGMSCGYGEIEKAAQMLVRVCQDCERHEVQWRQRQRQTHCVQDIMTHAKQTCAYITQKAGRDFIRLRFIQLLTHSVNKFSVASAVFKCSACMGYADCKFSEDAEVVKEPKLQRFLEETFGVRASMPRRPVMVVPPPPPPPAEAESDQEEINDDDDDDE
jgi:hypothetical protein